MGVKINMPQPQQESSMGRRLFGMAAPIVGGLVGGPAGAAAGAALGSKVNGGSTQDALLSGAQAGVSAKVAPQAPTMQGLDASKNLSMPKLGDSAMGRKLDASSQNPMVAAREGLDALPHLEAQGLINNDQRKDLTGTLIKLDGLAAAKKRYF